MPSPMTITSKFCAMSMPVLVEKEWLLKWLE
jgi:hypothetical protein